MIRFRSVALACSLALTSFAVLGAASSSASVTNIQFQLTDLKPGDDQASGYSFSMPARYHYSATDGLAGTSGYQSNWWGSSEYSTGTDSFALNEEAGREQWGGASAGYAVGASSIGVSGQAHGPSTSYGSVMNDLRGGIKAAGTIEVAPHSELRVSFDYQLLASATDPMDGQYGDYPSDMGQAFAEFSLHYRLPGQYEATVFSEQIYAHADAVGDYLDVVGFECFEVVGGGCDYFAVWGVKPGHEQVSRREGTFQGLISNTSDSSITATLYIGLEAKGYGSSAPVPEPSAALLALSGLAMAAAGARRRSQRMTIGGTSADPM